MKHNYILVSFLLLGILNSKAQTVQFFQSFESLASDNWNYSIDPVTYNTEGDLIVNGSDDVWAVIEEFTGDIDNASEGNLFFGVQDINNSNGGGDFYHTITLDPIDVSSLTDMTLSFDYFSAGYDSTDFIKYEILLDNTSSFADNTANDGSVGGIDLNKNTQAWTTVSTVIPNGTAYVRLRIKVKQNGSSDYLGIDNIVLSTNSTLSLDSLNGPSLVNLFPNPATQHIQISGLKKSENYSIYNVVGAEILKGAISNNQKINIQDLTNGIYFLKFENGNTIKFIKK